MKRMFPASSQRIQVLGLGDRRAVPRQDPIVPGIQILVLGDPRVSPQEDLAEAGPNAQRDRLVQVLAGPLLRGAIAAAIEQEQGFRRIGQRDQERMVTPPAVVADVHSLLALGIGLHDGAIGVQDRLIEKRVGLLSPDPQPRFIDGVHQGEDIGLGREAAAEVPGGRRVGDSFGSQGIEVDLIVASQFEVFDSLAAGEEIECDVEHMVGFVVGQMPLEQMQSAVDLLVEFDLLSHQKDGADAPGTESPHAIGPLIVDIGRGHHGYGPLGSGSMGESLLDSPPSVLEESLLACGAFFSDSGTHSKAPLFWNSEDVFSPTLFQKPAGFSSFF